MRNTHIHYWSELDSILESEYLSDKLCGNCYLYGSPNNPDTLCPQNQENELCPRNKIYKEILVCIDETNDKLNEIVNF